MRGLLEQVPEQAFGQVRQSTATDQRPQVPGITTDTHVLRLSKRFGWTSSDDPVVVEADVAGLFPRRDLTVVSHRVIWHGRRRCHARNPACGACPVASLCPSYGVGEVVPAKAAALVREPRA